MFIVLAHWNNNPRVDMSLHSDTIFGFLANQYLLLLLIDVCLTEKHQIPILKCLVWPDWGSTPRSTVLEVCTLTITPPMRFKDDMLWEQNNMKWKLSFITINDGGKIKTNKYYIIWKYHQHIITNNINVFLNKEPSPSKMGNHPSIKQYIYYN
jgi:hypothetical protein